MKKTVATPVLLTLVVASVLAMGCEALLAANEGNIPSAISESAEGRNRIARVREIATGVAPLDSAIRVMAGFGSCVEQAWDVGAFYSWSGKNTKGVRFTASSSSILTSVLVRISALQQVGTGGVDLLVLQDSIGLPDQLIAAKHVDHESITLGGWTTVDMADFQLVLGGDYHVAVQISNSTTDDYKLTSDDGLHGAGRSSIYTAEGWEATEDLLLEDYNWLIRDSMCSAAAVMSTFPRPSALNVNPNTVISATFYTEMDPSTVSASTYLINTSHSGLTTGTITYIPDAHTATFDPDVDFAAGEVVTVTLTGGIQSDQGIPLQPYSWQFKIATQGGGKYLPRVDIAAGNEPRDVAAAELNGDGFVDIVISNGNGADVSVFINSGTGAFISATTYAVGDRPVRVTCADIDNDGDNDLIVANHYSYTVSVLRNDGGGEFAPQQVYAVGTYTRKAAAADLDGDGDVDLAVANQGTNDVSMLLNDGTGAFGSAVSYAAGNAPHHVVAGDFDSDGDFDLAVANCFGGNVSILLNTGNATFLPRVDYPAAGNPYCLEVADLDGDGDLDIVTGNEVSDNISVLMNVGSGTFGSQIAYPSGTKPTAVCHADLDGDGDLDLVASNRDSHNLSTLLNDGSGVFGSLSLYGVGQNPWGVAAADLDNDGDLDMVSANRYSYNMSIFYAYTCGDVNGSGGDPAVDIDDVVYLINYIFAGGPAPVPVEAGDANCSGGDPAIDIDDVVYLITYIFSGGPAPCAECP